jgi:hypothetical protein
MSFAKFGSFLGIISSIKFSSLPSPFPPDAEDPELALLF